MRTITQRDVMRALYREHDGGEAQTIAAYAAAERQGRAPRIKSISTTSPEAYARALFNDGLVKRWLRL